MWSYPDSYDVIVIGGGHAGCEAAHAAARMGVRTLLLTMSLDTVGKMSCNPAIGGIAKGHLTREIDALGGIMGKATDRAAIQYRMLNRSRGPAVWAPRAQCDRVVYQTTVKSWIEKTPNLTLRQATIESLLTDGNRITGVTTKEGVAYSAPCVVISSGTFMRGLMHYGESQASGGRAGDQPSVGLSANLEALGFRLGRLKTGTPPRVLFSSLDLSKTELQPGEEGVQFSYDDQEFTPLKQLPCYITYTNEETKRVIQENIHRSPMYSGKIKGIGPRYCPSIEDKVMRFAHKERHQIFLEPEGVDTDEVYINGVSSSLPIDVQLQIVQSIPGLERAVVTRWAYAVEYDYVTSGQIGPTLETRTIEGLFLAGQINGTSGYEEAAAQGLVAGINAARKVQQKPPLTLSRADSYIGVMIDDLITKGLDEPYRMFTSRAEHRLLLRQDNADLRLRGLGYEMGLISEEQYQRLLYKQQTLESEINRLSTVYKQINGKGTSLSQLLCRPEMTYAQLVADYPDVHDHGSDINHQIELTLKYAGYLQRQQAEVARFDQIERIKIPANFDFRALNALRNEAKEKLSRHQPQTVGQASRISGVSPADLSVLMVALKAAQTHECACVD